MSLQKSTQKKLSKATIETLSIIVYHQPVTRSEIEEIRGVSFASNTLEILLELNWVRPAGRKDVPGKPIQYATTENFLNHFNIQKLSKATIETLAIIVYHQPVTRSEIEEIRGVAFASNTLEILFELNWVKPAGRKNVPGKPIQYATTENFLNHFNVQKLSDLPTIDELGSAGLIDTSSIDKSIFGTGKFFKEQSIKENQNDLYEDIDEAIKKAPDEEK